MNGFKFEFGGKTVDKKKLVGKLEASVSTIDQNGNINIVFNSNLLIPESFEPLIELDAIKFTLRKSNGTSVPIQTKKSTTSKLRLLNTSSAANNSSTDLNLTYKHHWEIVSFDKNILSLRLNFKDPFIVSDSAVSALIIII